MREWEKRLERMKKVKLQRVAGRIVESFTPENVKVDFCPCHIRRWEERKKMKKKK